MTVREYELSLSPRAAITALQQSTALDALYSGELPTTNGSIMGTVTARDGQVTLEGQRIRSHLLCYPLTARVQLELRTTHRGTVLTLQKLPARLRDIAEFRRILAVAALSLLVIACLSPLVASWVLGVQALCVAVVWLLNRRGIALVNDALVGLVWRVWAPALRSHAPGVYRGLPAA